MAVHEIIKKLREEFTKQTTLPHSRPGQGHTQYYAEHVEIEYMKQQQTIESLKCCGNCQHRADQGFFTEACHNCTRNIGYQNPIECNDNWQPKENI